MASPTKVYFPSFMLKICGELYPPASDSPDRKGAAVVISHPMTGVKEQTSADYARFLCKAGFYALTFDAGYQGESTGEPRKLEDPHQRAEDCKAAVSYLTTLESKVDPECIGLLGICASGGYTSYAAQSDSRIRALATVSGACVGRMTRNGGIHEYLEENAEAIAGAQQAASQWRTKVARGQHLELPTIAEMNPSKLPKGADAFSRGAADYYGTDRGHHERSEPKQPMHSFDLLINYDSFNFQHLISPRALLMIAGSEAETLHYSRTATDIAKEPKELFVVNGRNHFDLYDNLTESGPKLVEFFDKYLAQSADS